MQFFSIHKWTPSLPFFVNLIFLEKLQPKKQRDVKKHGFGIYMAFVRQLELLRIFKAFPLLQEMPVGDFL